MTSMIGKNEQFVLYSADNYFFKNHSQELFSNLYIQIVSG